jgi:hypothetical protein
MNCALRGPTKGFPLDIEEHICLRVWLAICIGGYVVVESSCCTPRPRVSLPLTNPGPSINYVRRVPRVTGNPAPVGLSVKVQHESRARTRFLSPESFVWRQKLDPGANVCVIGGQELWVYRSK